MKLSIQKDTGKWAFIEPLFTTVKRWKQLKRSLTDEWIKRTWHTYTMKYYSAVKRSETIPFAATWMT